MSDRGRSAQLTTDLSQYADVLKTEPTAKQNSRFLPHTHGTKRKWRALSVIFSCRILSIDFFYFVLLIDMHVRA